MNRIYLFILFTWILSPQKLTAGSINDSIPDVHFVVVRVDLLTFGVEGFYEFTQPFRKSLPDEGFIGKGNIFYNHNN